MDRIWNLSNLKHTCNSPPTTVKLQIVDSHSWSIFSNPYTDNTVIPIVSSWRTKPATGESGKCQIIFLLYDAVLQGLKIYLCSVRGNNKAFNL